MKRILLVDDEPCVLEFFISYLSRAGFVVDTALSAEAGLVALEANTPDLIICDIRMHGMGGLNFARSLKASGMRDIPLIALSGLGRESDIAAGAEAGFDGYLLKPINPETMLAQLRVFIR